MAYNKITKPGLFARNRTIQWEGSFTGNDAVAPAAFDLPGVASVGRPATGRYTIVVPGDGQLRLSSIQLTVLAAAGRCANVRSYDPATRLLTIDVYDLATPTAQDLTTAEQCFVSAVINQSNA